MMRFFQASMKKSRRRPGALTLLGALGLIAPLLVAQPAACQGEISPFGLGDADQDNVVTARSVLSFASVAPGDTVRAAIVIDIEPAWHINSSQPYEDFLIPAEVIFDTIPELTPWGVTFPSPHDVQLGDQLMSVYDGQVIIGFHVAVDNDSVAGEYTLPVSFVSQPCDDRTCLAPRTLDIPLTISIGQRGAAANAGVFSKLDQAGSVTQTNDSSSETTAQESELLEIINKYGFWGYLLVLGIAFVTGLLLSFSPCTYPMIPITVSIFAGQQRSVGKGFVLSLFYVGSMAVMYGIMGLIVSLVGGVFGAWLASPPVVIGIAVIFVVFALSMFGLYELQVPASIRNRLGKSQKGGGGVLGAIILGIVAALVVSPCVGPFVAGILVYVATSGSPIFGFLVLFIFAMGLGTLFIIIGTFSNAINKLPRSGEWMEQVKKFFGFILLLMAIYFMRTLISPQLTAILTGILLVVFGVFGGGLDRLSAESGFFPRLKKLLGVVSFLIGVYLLLGSMLINGFILPPASTWLPTAGGSTQVQEKGIPWETNLDSALAKATAENKPVLIDTWATWCVNCKVLEEKTFKHPDVVAAAERFVPVKVQLETSSSPATIDFKQRFGLKQYSLPTTVLLTSKGAVHRILPGVIDPDDMLEYMRQVN